MHPQGSTTARYGHSEMAQGRWGLGGTTLPFGDELQDRFPLVGRFLDKEGKPALSQQAPNRVAEVLKGPGRRVKAVEPTAIGADPKFFIRAFGDAEDIVVAQRIVVERMTEVSEMA